jgi:antitoxin ParD1/3/4
MMATWRAEEGLDMEPITVALADSVKAFVDELVASREFPSASDYVVDLIRQAQVRRARRKLAALLREGLDSGPATEMNEEEWNAIRDEVRRRHAERQSGKNGVA